MKLADLFNSPGLRCTGDISHPSESGGAPVPVFEPVALPGQPDINTLEGWTALVNKCNSKAFRQVFGRDPVCIAALRAWEDKHFSKDFRWEGIPA